jgi:hypothetical protein
MSIIIRDQRTVSIQAELYSGNGNRRRSQTSIARYSRTGTASDIYVLYTSCFDAELSCSAIRVCEDLVSHLLSSSNRLLVAPIYSKP